LLAGLLLSALLQFLRLALRVQEFRDVCTGILKKVPPMYVQTLWTIPLIVPSLLCFLSIWTEEGAKKIPF